MANNAQKDGSLQSQIGQTGARGEALAAEYLNRKRDFCILARNWRNPYDRREEIDIVALQGNATVFVEVKTRTAGCLLYTSPSPRDA